MIIDVKWYLIDKVYQIEINGWKTEDEKNVWKNNHLEAYLS